jgi:hypothetical protein
MHDVIDIVLTHPLADVLVDLIAATATLQGITQRFVPPRKSSSFAPSRAFCSALERGIETAQWARASARLGSTGEPSPRRSSRNGPSRT